MRPTQWYHQTEPGHLSSGLLGDKQPLLLTRGFSLQDTSGASLHCAMCDWPDSERPQRPTCERREAGCP